MTQLRRTLRVAALLWAAALPLPAALAGQLVPVRTVPVASGDQFLLAPGARLGMGGVSIALDDRLGDPFANPALGARLEGTSLFASPVYYSITRGNGDGRTLPLGLLLAGEEWFGTGLVALQQITGSRWTNPCCWIFDVPRNPGTTDPSALSNRASTNLYAAGSLGRRLAGGRGALAASAAWSNLSAMDGVDLLYASSAAIRQDGDILDVRLGYTRELGQEQRLDLVLLHNRIDMVHDVTYIDWVWRPGPTPQPPLPTRRVERNEDRTRIWGAHANYTRPLDDEGWRAGGIATVNFMTHPKIPNYEIMNIPRDPGHSWAFNLGVGAGREDGPVSLGVDLVYEPIWSNTWADTETEIVTERGTRIPPGGKTVENHFRFDNAHLRIGAGREGRRLGFQLGLHVHSISYTLDQDDFVLGRSRTQDESWMEWTPSWGLSGRFPELEVRYAGRLISGTGRPGIAWDGFAQEAAPARLAAGNFILAPSGPLNLQETPVWSHQVTVSVPLGSRR